MLSCPADVRVQDFLLRSHGDAGNGSHSAALQQSCTLLLQRGVQLLSDFTRRAAAWTDGGVVRADLGQVNLTGRHSGIKISIFIMNAV